MTRVLARIEAKLTYRNRRRHGFDLSTDPVLSWMVLATCGMLHPGQYALIERAIAELPTDDPVIEIGSFAGLSTNTITHVLRKLGRPNVLISTDPWDFERSDEEQDSVPDSDVSMRDLREHVRSQFMQNSRFWNPDRLPHALELHSDDFFAAWSAGETRTDIFDRPVQLGGPASFVFIDGDHRDEQARRDFAHADQIIVPGGFILLDDSDRFGAWPHLYELALEARDSHGYEIVGENPHVLLRKRG